MIEVVESVVSEDGLVYGILIPRTMSRTLWVYIGVNWTVNWHCKGPLSGPPDFFLQPKPWTLTPKSFKQRSFTSEAGGFGFSEVVGG